METMSRKKKKDSALATQVIAVETEATRYRVLLRMSIPSLYPRGNECYCACAPMTGSELLTPFNEPLNSI